MESDIQEFINLARAVNVCTGLLILSSYCIPSISNICICISGFLIIRILHVNISDPIPDTRVLKYISWGGCLSLMSIICMICGLIINYNYLLAAILLICLSTYAYTLSIEYLII